MLNDELQKFVLDSLQEGKGFILEQAPDVVQQYLNWTIVSNGVGAIVWGILLIVSIVCLFKFVKLFIKSESEGDEALHWFVGGIISLTVAIISIVSFPVCTYTFLYVWVAPKAYLLEKFIN